jgi:hypothetical protein
MPRWKVQLTGDPEALEDAALTFCGPLLTIAADGDEFFLSADELETMETAGEVEKSARRLLQVANGLLSVTKRNYKPIAFGYVVQVAPNGQPTSYLNIVENFVLTDRLEFCPPAVKEPPIAPDKAEALVALAQQDANVDHALRLWTTKPHTLAELHKVLEVIEKKDANGSVNSRGWATKTELDSFGGSANNPALSGDEARHAYQQGRPPKCTPMTAGEAEQFIARILNNWLLSKLQPEGESDNAIQA